VSTHLKKKSLCKKCSHTKQITVIKESKCVEAETMQKEKQDSVLLPAVNYFFIIKIIIEIRRIFISDKEINSAFVFKLIVVVRYMIVMVLVMS
jgi:hypothetical protein